MSSNDNADKQKILLKLSTNFMKMLSEEDCENIKLKFWIGLEEQINKQGLDKDLVVKIIFEEILNKNSQILTEKNLFFCISNFLRNKSSEIFDNYFLTLLFKHLQNYEETKFDFNDFLVELMFNLYFTSEFNISSNYNTQFSNEILNKIKKILFSLIDFDIDLFEVVFKSNTEFNDQFLFEFFYVNEFSEIFNYLMEKLLIKNKFESIIFLLDKIECSILNKKDLLTKNDKLFKNITSTYLNLCFNFILAFDSEESPKQNNIFLMEKVLKNIYSIVELQMNKNSENDGLFNSVEKFLIFILENIYSTKKIVFSNLNIFMKFLEFSCNNKHVFQNYKNIIIIIMYSFSEEIYDIKSLKFYENLMEIIYSQENKDSLSIIISEILLKSFSLNQKTRYFSSPNFTKQKYTFSISNEYSTKTNMAIKDLIYFYNSSNFNLINFLIIDSFCLEEIDNKMNIQFNQMNFINNMKVLLTLNLETYDQEFENLLFKFVFQMLLTFYEEFYVKAKLPPNLELFEVIFFKLNRSSDKQFLKTEIYSIILNFLQSILFPNFIHFNQNMKILDLFFNFLFEFCKQDNIANLTSKLLTSLFNLKQENVVDLKKSNKLYALEKYAELVDRVNSAKMFTQYFNFCLESLKKEESPIIYYSIYKYASRYEGALQNGLLEFVFNKFEKTFESIPENLTFDALFSLSSIYEILVKDQPEKVVNKIYENFYNTKLLRILDKFFKDLSTKEEVWNEILFGQNSDLKCEHIHRNLEKLNIANLILNNQTDSNHLALSILLHLSKIFSLFISNIISNNKDHFDVKTLSDKNNITISSLLQTFDYITNGILFSEGKKTIPQLIFLNDFFGHLENLNFFYNTHSYYMAMNEVEKQNLDLSQLNEVNTIINRDKNKQFINFMKINENSIFLMKNLINNIFTLEGNLIYLLDSKKYSQINKNGKNFVIDSLYNNSSISSITKNEILTVINQNKNLSPLFIKVFLEVIYSTEKDESALKLNENIYLFLLYHNIFIKYFKNINDLLNFDLILVNYYHVIKTYKYEDVLKNFFNFLLTFSKINKNIFNFSFRLVMNSKIFKAVLLPNNCITNELYNLIIYLLVQILFYSSYKNESMNYILSIINNVEATILTEANTINYTNLTNYGKLIVEIFSSLRIHSDETSHMQIEINKKFKESLVVYFNDEILVKYVNYLFVVPFSNDDNIKLLEDNLLLYCENYDILLNLKGSKIITEKSTCKRLLKENILAENILLFQEIAFPKSLYELLGNYCKLVISVNDKPEENKITSIYLKIIENYILHHLIFKNNEKLLFDVSRNLLFNTDFINIKEINLTWERKYKFLSMMFLQLLKDTSAPYTIFNHKTEAMKRIGFILNANILKKTGFGNILIESIGKNNELMQMKDSIEYFHFFSGNAGNKFSKKNVPSNTKHEKINLADNEIFGEFLYNFIEQIYPGKASIITGMFMNCDLESRAKLMSCRPEELKKVIDKAHSQLRQQQK